ncbi:MAG: DMT family transporter [Hyphomonadaceae bacterium]|nr:DMT family transporter [Hyphomonadaceae bacterium]
MPVSLIWIPIVVFGAAFQTARNALQRALVETAGPWGATLVRFLFGLPFAFAWWAAAALIWGVPSSTEFRFMPFVIACLVGALAQVIATAALLQSMRKSNFALGSFFSQSTLPLTAIGGLFVGDLLSWPAALGVAIATLGLAVVSWPKRIEGGLRNWSAARYGVLSGAMFAISGNAFREGAHAVSMESPFYAAAVAVAIVQLMQSAGLIAWLVATDRPALRTALSTWRVSLGAGFCGWAASACAFTALAFAPAAMVRVVAVVDMPMAALAGRGLFLERLTARQIGGAVLIACGVIATALGSL